jgi:hypothetical protein
MQVRKLLMVVAAAVPLLSAGVVVGVHSAAGSSWEEMTAWARQAERDWMARDFKREALWGETTPGVAFVAYAEALAMVETAGRGDEALLRELVVQPERVPEAVATDFALRWAQPIAALRRGAHCRDARPPVQWPKGFAHEATRLLTARSLVNAALVEVRRLAGRGEDRAAVELSLDVATYGADLLQSPVLVEQMIAAALLAIATGETWRDEDLGRLGAPSLALLEDGLRRLDGRVPATLCWKGEALLLANTLMHPAQRASLLGDESLPLRSWRYGWSTRWAAADAVLLELEAQRRLDAAADARWPRRQELLRAAFADADLQDNPLLGVAAPNWMSAEQSLRATLTVVRLLRLAVACRAGAELPPLADPLGDGKLQATRAAGILTLRSAGRAGNRPRERTVTTS